MSNHSPPLVVCIGEALVDFVARETGVDLEHAVSFTRSPGGAIANVAVGLARLGIRSRLVSGLGSDPFGRFMRKFLEGEGVDVSRVALSDLYPTALVFVSLDENRVPDFWLFNNPSADLMITENDVGRRDIDGAAFLHAGTVSMVTEQARGATLKLIRLARDMGVRFHFDPNFRLHLWKDHEMLKHLALEICAGSQVVKLNADELAFLTGEGEVEAGATRLKELGADVVIVTLGPGGAWFLCDHGEGSVPGFEVEVVDTTGAGDGFAAGLLSVLARLDHWPPDKGDLEGAVRLANAVGAMVTTRTGAVAALPDSGQVKQMLVADPGG